MSTINSWNNQIAAAKTAITLNSGTNNVNISTDASATTVSIGSGAAAKAVTLGSTNSTSSTTVQSGSGALAITSTNGTLTANSGTGALSISSDASATTVNIATGAAAKTVTLGSTNTTSTTTINSGTGNIALNAGLTVDSSGRMTNSVQPRFLAYNSATDSNATGDGTVVSPVQFDTEVFDIGSNFASNTFTAPKTGTYYLSSVVLLSNSTSGTSASISIVTTARTFVEGGLNNTAVKTSSNFCGLFGFAVADMTAGDTAIVTCTVSSGTKTVAIFGTTSPFTFFQGYLIA